MINNILRVNQSKLVISLSGSNILNVCNNMKVCNFTHLLWYSFSIFLCLIVKRLKEWTPGVLTLALHLQNSVSQIHVLLLTAKARRQPKPVKPKKMIRLDSKTVIYAACNSGSSAVVSKDGEVFMFGKDTYHCDHATGTHTLIHENGIGHVKQLHTSWS